MRDPFSLEPPDGDYVAYLDKLMKGKIGSLSPLSVTADNGMVTVRSTAEPAPLQGDAVPADTDDDPYLKNEPVVRMGLCPHPPCGALDCPRWRHSHGHRRCL